MKFIQFRIGDVVQMKKQHPCGSSEWEVLQLGSDMRVKCRGCGRIVLIARPKFLKGAKKVLNRDVSGPTELVSRKEYFILKRECLTATAVEMVDSSGGWCYNQ